MAPVEIIAANLKNENQFSVNCNRKKRVCAYARVSTDSDEQLNSFESQKQYYTEKIQSNPDWEFVGIYADEGISGTQVKNRVQFQKMIDDALNGKIDIILAKSISRFARNTVDTLENARKLSEKKVDVYFEKENIHTLDLDSELFLTFFSAFAQSESESLSQNVKLGLKAKMKRGEPTGKAECYGYTWNKETKQLEVNEEQAKVVRMIFNWYISGDGGRVIAKKLNKLGIKTYTGSKWSQATISDIIRQEKYVGDTCGQKYYSVSPITHKKVKNYGEKEKYYARGTHEAIISRDTWDKAQTIINKRSEACSFNKGSKYKSRYTRKYAFSSKIRCAYCGKNYIRKQSSKTKPTDEYNIYWICYSRSYDSKSCQDSIWIREEYLEEAFVELYNNIILNKHKTKDKLLNAILEIVNDDSNKVVIRELYDKKEKLELRLSNLIDMKLDDIKHKDIYNAKESEIYEELSNIKEQIKVKENELEENQNINSKIKQIEDYFDEPVLLKEFNREAFDSIVDTILVGDYDDNGNKLPRVVRFVLKTGVEYSFDFPEVSRKKNGNDRVLFSRENVV